MYQTGKIIVLQTFSQAKFLVMEFSELQRCVLLLSLLAVTIVLDFWRGEVPLLICN